MPHSDAERRRAYAAEWRKRNPGYQSKWRKAHRKEENARALRWRVANKELVRAAKARYYAQHPRQSQAAPDISIISFQGHPFFETAFFICGPRPYFRPEAWEDTMGSVVLALVEGTDPDEAARRARSFERTWQYTTGPIYDNVDVVDGTLQVVITKSFRS